MILSMMISCDPRTGTHHENDPIKVPKIETCIVESIGLSYGKHQYFIIKVKNKTTSYYITTKEIDFNVRDSVIVVDETIIMKKK